MVNTCLELFAGAGGLALGIERAGFRHLALVERDSHARRTIEGNNLRGYYGTPWALHATADARLIDYSTYRERITLLAGGPPCQPFSLGGNHLGRSDARDLFPTAIRAVRESAPLAFLFENVPALMRPSFADYVEYIRLSLGVPSVVRGRSERWQAHLKRLKTELASDRRALHSYDVHVLQVQCADFGIPQLRTRMFLVGFRRDLNVRWTPPPSTHSRGQLLRSQYVTNAYWKRHGIRPKKTPPELSQLVEEVSRDAGGGKVLPWVTVRDLLAVLGRPHRLMDRVSVAANQHVYVPGARTYLGHTGSSLDGLAKTIKAGVHGIPGGENIVRLDNGRIRYFTVREAACLQGFPSDYLFEGSWAEVMRQIGNAVPVPVARAIASRMYECLERAANDQAKPPTIAISA